MITFEIGCNLGLSVSLHFNKYFMKEIGVAP